jgi:hypothetical protein
MDDLVNNIEPEVPLQKLANCINAGDRASLDGNFLQAVSQYEEALSMLGEQVSFDFEKTSDCLNKLINVHTHLENKDKLEPLVEQLTQIERTRSVKMLQSSVAFFAQRNDPENDLLLDDKLNAPSDEADVTILDASGTVQKNCVIDGVGLSVANEPKTDPLAILNFSKAPIFLLVASAVFLFAAGKLFSTVVVIAGSHRDSGLESFSGLQYATCDHAKSLKFTKDGLCIASDSSGTIKSKYWVLPDQLNDFPDLFRGYLRRKEYWYRSEGDELVDHNNVVFYQPTACEKNIVDKMWFYAKCAQDQYEENKSYPSSLEKSKQTYQNFGYINPSTGKFDYAELLVLGLQGNKLDLGSRGASDRQWRPGAILCLRADTKHFCVQGFDRRGRPLVGSDPSRYFVINLEYGKCLTPELAVSGKVKTWSASKQDLPPKVNAAPLQESESTVVFIDNDGSVENSITALRRLPQIILWSALLVAISCLVFSKKFKQPQQIELISDRSIVCCIIGLIVFYIIALL